MSIDEAMVRIAQLEARNRFLERDNHSLEATAFSYRIVLEHMVALSVAAGADVGEAVEVLQRRPSVGGHLRRVK